MKSALADVLIHVDESLNEEAMGRIEEEMRSDDGIVSIGHRRGQSHLLLVVYDTEIAHASNLLNRFQARGLHAQTVGF